MARIVRGALWYSTASKQGPRITTHDDIAHRAVFRVGSMGGWGSSETEYPSIHSLAHGQLSIHGQVADLCPYNVPTTTSRFFRELGCIAEQYSIGLIV